MTSTSRTARCGPACRVVWQGRSLALPPMPINPRTIRYYEEIGLLAPARSGQRRVYGEGDRVRLRLILRGHRLGFGLEEIRETLALYNPEEGEKAQLRRVLRMGGAKLREIEAQIAELEAVRVELAERAGEIRRLLEKA